MFRTPPYLEKTAYVQFNLDTPLTFPGNNQKQKKSAINLPQQTGTIFMTGTTLISASISSLKL